jgi:hypothetical protein
MHFDESTLPDHICRGEEALVRQLVQEGNLAGRIVEYWVRREREGFRCLARDRLDRLANSLMSVDDVNASIFLLSQPTIVGILYRSIISLIESTPPFKSWRSPL